MRIIAGKYRHRLIKSVDGLTTRPSADRLKESLFNMIGPYFDGGIMLDCCGGSGAIALECLSRGFDHAVIVENDTKAIGVIQENIKSLNLDGSTTVYKGNILDYLDNTNTCFDFIYLDPPYALSDLYTQVLEKISKRHLLKDGGIVVVEKDSKDNMVETIDQLVLYKERSYTRSKLGFYHYKKGEE